MKSRLKKHLPSTKSMLSSPELKRLKAFLMSPCFWARDQQSIARGVAAGLAAAVLPGIQIFYAAILVILLRGNLPIALLFTFVTNPFTVAPITYFVYVVGEYIIDDGKADYAIQHFHWDFSSFHAFFANASNSTYQLGKAFLIGLPIVSLCFGLIGYFGTIFILKMSIFLFHKK